MARTPLITMPTLAEMQERTQKSLDRNDYVPGMNIEDLRAQKRRRIEHLLGRQGKIMSIASAEQQQFEEYREQRFNKKFRRLSDFETIPGLDYEGEQLRWHLWSKLPDSPFKRFQELFCDEKNFILPKFRVVRGNILFENANALITFDVDACLVSPERVSQDFLENVGLRKFEKGEPELSRLEKCMTAIPELKAVWKSSTLLTEGNNRIMILHPSEETKPTLLNKVSHQVQDGAIAYISGNVNGKKKKKPAEKKKDKDPSPPRHLKVQYFPTAYDAYRKTHLEWEEYDVEIGKIQELIVSIKNCNGELNAAWSKATPEQRNELVQKTNDLVAKAAEALDACRDDKKVDANELLAACTNLRDTLGRLNPSAPMAKMVGARNRLEKRSTVIPHINKYNIEDQGALKNALEQHECALRTFRGSIISAARAVQKDRHYFTPPSLPREEAVRLQGQLEIEMGLQTQLLGNLTLEPFCTIRERMIEKVGHLQRGIRTRDIDATIRHIIELHDIGKFQAVCTCIEHFKHFANSEEDIPLQRIDEFLAELDAQLTRREIFPDVEMPGYKEWYERLVEKVAALKAFISARKAYMTTEECAEFAKGLRTKLDEFKALEMIRRLP